MSTTRRETVLALAIAAGALALRLFRLDHLSYWTDESQAVLTARLPLGDITSFHLDQAIRYTYPPLYTYVLHGWFAVVGATSLTGRLFSAVCGTAAVFLLFLLVRRLAGAPAGLLAAALFAVSQIGVAYSQEARAYAFMFVLALGAAWLLDVALTERRLGAWLGFCALSAALAMTHYQTLWVLIALWTFALAAPIWGLKPLPIRWWMGGVAGCVALVGPWLIAGGLSGLSAARVHWDVLPSYFQATWGTLYNVLGAYHNARWSGLLYAPNPKPTLAGLVIYLLPALLALGAAVVVVLTRRCSPEREERGALLLGLTAALAMVGPVAMTVLARGVPYDLRYTSPGIGFYCGLVAIGAMRLGPRSLRWTAIVVMLAVGLAALHTNYFKPYKEDWRGALGWLADAARPDDVTLFPGLGMPPNTWAVYHPDRVLPTPSRLEDVLTGKQPARRVWLFTYGRTVVAERAGRRVALELERHGYTRVEGREFHWIDTSIWEKRGS